MEMKAPNMWVKKAVVGAAAEVTEAVMKEAVTKEEAEEVDPHWKFPSQTKSYSPFQSEILTNNFMDYPAIR